MTTTDNNGTPIDASVYDTSAPQRRETARKVLFPNVSSWHELFPTFSTDKNAAPAAFVHRFQHDVYVGKRGMRKVWDAMTIGAYCRIDTRAARFNTAYVGAYDVVNQGVLANTVWIENETMSWQITEWPDGKALVQAQHSRIIGGVWVAVIDVATIPARLRGVTSEEAQS